MKVDKMPSLRWLIMCDEYGRVEGSRKELIIGAFDSIISKKFPYRHPKMWLLMKLQGATGEFENRFNIKDPDGNLLFKSKNVKFNLKTSTAQHTINVSLVNFVFPKPGVYRIEVYINDEQVSEAPLVLIKHEEVPESKKH